MEDHGFYALTDEDITQYNTLILESDEWMDLIAAMDRCPLRAAERAKVRDKARKLRTIFTQQPCDLETFHHPLKVDVTDPEVREFQAVPCPPAFLAPGVLVATEKDLLSDDGTETQRLIWECLRELMTESHATRWRLDQLSESVRCMTLWSNDGKVEDKGKSSKKTTSSSSSSVQRKRPRDK